MSVPASNLLMLQGGDLRNLYIKDDKTYLSGTSLPSVQRRPGPRSETYSYIFVTYYFIKQLKHLYTKQLYTMNKYLSLLHTPISTALQIIPF